MTYSKIEEKAIEHADMAFSAYDEAIRQSGAPRFDGATEQWQEDTFKDGAVLGYLAGHASRDTEVAELGSRLNSLRAAFERQLIDEQELSCDYHGRGRGIARLKEVIDSLMAGEGLLAEKP